MTLRVVIDTNIWIRILLKGRVTLPLLTAFNENKFHLVMSQPLLDEFHTVWILSMYVHIIYPYRPSAILSMYVHAKIMSKASQPSFKMSDFVSMEE